MQQQLKALSGGLFHGISASFWKQTCLNLTQKLSKTPKSASFCRFFMLFGYIFKEFVWVRWFKTVKGDRIRNTRKRKTSYAVCYFEETCSILLQKYFKSDPDESEVKSPNSTFLKQSSEFFEKFLSLEDKKPSTANKYVIQLVF